MPNSPVSKGFFHFGTELVLWRPGLCRDELHRRALWAAVLPDAALYAVTGLVTIALSMLTAPVIHTVLAAGCLLFVVAVLMARHDYRNWGHELGAMSVWRIDRGHGQLFFKPTDFADQQPHAVHAVVRIIDAVHAIHTRPAADWVDAEQLRQLHHLAWDTLAQVHQCPSVHRDREPITDALELVATHVRLLNQRLTGLAAMNTIDAILADVAAVHGVLDPRPRLTGSDVGTQR